MKAVFLDRDGTICKDVHYCSRIEDFEILPGVPQAIRLFNQLGLKVVVITNQSGIARGYFTESKLNLIHRFMNENLAKDNARIDVIYYCPHHPDEGCSCRKPKPGLVLRAAAELGISLSESYFIGDTCSDVSAGKAAGCKTVWLNSNSVVVKSKNLEPDYVCANLLSAAPWILQSL